MSGTPTFTVSRLLLRVNLWAIETMGIDADAVLSRMGMTRADVDALPAMHSYELSESFWDAAVEVSGDEFLGVHVAELVRPEHFDVLGYVARHSANLGQAVGRLLRYGTLLGNRHLLKLEPEGDQLCLRLLERAGFPPHRQAVECLFASIGFMSRQLTGKQLYPTAAYVRHGPPADRDELVKLFGSHLHFDADKDAIVFPAKFLELPVIGHDPTLAEILERQAAVLVARTRRRDGYVEQVRRHIARELSNGNPTAEHVAELMNTSVRTMSRKLKAEGTSHKKLLDQTRYGLAGQYLRRTKMDMGEVAFLLGFADASSFDRAFKRWSGVTPTDYRRGDESPEA